MRVVKFGGTSVGDADRIRSVADRITDATVHERCFAVLSAASGVTNLLIDAAAQAEAGADVTALADAYLQRHLGILHGLAPELAAEVGAAEVGAAEAGVRALYDELLRLLQGISLLKEASPSAQARVASLGERASVVILAALLRARGVAHRAVDPRELLRLGGDPLSATPDEAVTRASLQATIADGGRLYLTGGFFGADDRGRTALLGRGGSDWSAALIAAGVGASLLEIWTDVDGIFTADPRLVPEASAVPEMSFAEAAELAYFGAKVLHPKTVAPARERGIPVRVCNSFRPEAPGTWLREAVPPPPAAVRGISSLDGLAMIDVSGPGLRGVPGVAARVFGACASRDVSIVLITQASSECSISFCVHAPDAERARAAVSAAFEAEIASGRVDPVAVSNGRAIVSIVGDGMSHRPGVAGTFFGALADIGCNVIAIAQGSSERSISAVIESEQARRAVARVHACFFHTADIVEIYLAGVGLVGSRLIDLIARQRDALLAAGLDLRVVAAADSRQQAMSDVGLPLNHLRDVVRDGTPRDWNAWMDAVRERRPTHPVFVDCTASDDVADRYPALFDAGFHIVTANKKANAGPFARWTTQRQVAARRRRRYLYETHVGAGLPVIDTVKSLIHSGDRVLSFQGILSGTLSFLYGLLDDGVALSAAVRTARERGFTEPDPRDDLSGADMARKILILAREFGHVVEPSDVEVVGVIPGDFDGSGSVDVWMSRLTDLDDRFGREAADRRARGVVLRYVGAIGPDGLRVGPTEVAVDHPLAAIRGGENALSFLTAHYQPKPMIIRGYGAGADVTATGVLGDILRVVR